MPLDHIPDPPANGLMSISLDLMDQLFEELPDAPYFVKDNSLHYLRANRAMAELCGVGASGDLLGRSARDYFVARQWMEFEDLDRHILRSGRAVRDQLVGLTRADGHTSWLLFGRWPVVRDGRVEAIVSVARNLSAEERSGDTMDRIGPTLDYIRRNYAASIKVTTLARLASVSVSQLERDFSSMIGASPRAYQKKVRLERAQELLRESKLSIADIAQACGYSDQSAFTRSFKSAIGCPPRTFRRQVG